MYVLGLAPNASRISIRFWEVGTLGLFARRLADHAADFALDPQPWKTAPSAYRVVLATAPHREGSAPKMDDAMSNLVGELMRAVLTGRPYPRSLLANVLMRMRSDGHLSGLRVGICKGILARERRLGINSDKEEIPVSLEGIHQPGLPAGPPVRRAGKRATSGLGRAGQRDHPRPLLRRGFGHTRLVFPMLLRNAQNHLGRLRKDRPGAAVGLEKDIREIVDGLTDSFPRSLRIEDQGRFAIGYYHQSQSRFNKMDRSDDSTDSTEDTSEEASA